MEILAYYSIDLKVRWVSTHKQKADLPSRTCSPQESILRKRHIISLKRIGVNLDAYATRENRVVTRYISQYCYSDQVCCDALSYQPRYSDVIFSYPPQMLYGAHNSVLVRKSRRCITLMHEYVGQGASLSLAQNEHEYRLLIGAFIIITKKIF